MMNCEEWLYSLGALCILMHRSESRESICKLSPEAATLYKGLKLDSPAVAKLLGEMKTNAPESVQVGVWDLLLFAMHQDVLPGTKGEGLCEKDT